MAAGAGVVLLLKRRSDTTSPSGEDPDGATAADEARDEELVLR
jgi:hypothetical protein